MKRLFYAIWIIVAGLLWPLIGEGANQYWDASTNAGYQHGDGTWSTNAADAKSVKWNAVAGGAGVLSAWVNGNSAIGGGTGGTSVITLSNTVTAGAVVVTGGVYTLVITNQGKLFTTNTCVVGSGFAAGNTILVTGNGSVWDLGGANLTNGINGQGTNNQLTIDQGGVVTNVNLLYCGLTNNGVTLLGGTLAVVSFVRNPAEANQLLTVGDGTQTAVFQVDMGAASSVNFGGLVIQSNATFKAQGYFNAGVPGVTLTNGAALEVGVRPGVSGLGVDSNLTWYGNSTYHCEMTNALGGPTVGWDSVGVNSQAVFMGSASLPNIIKLDSMGTAVANFDVTSNYNFKVMGWSVQSGFNAAYVQLDTQEFQKGVGSYPAGTWSVTNTGNGLWLVYRGGGVSGPIAAGSVWVVPSSGNWNDGANWQGGNIPASDANTVVAFGDNGTAYSSTNNMGSVTLNQMQFSGVSAVTNQIVGNPLVVTSSTGDTVTNGRMDFVSGSGTFVISNPVTFAAETDFRGEALDGTVILKGAVTNLATMRKFGTWTLALGASNTLSSGLEVYGGTVRIETNTAILGLPSILVTNPGILFYTGTPALVFGNSSFGRTALVTGPGALWTNTSLTLGSNSWAIINNGARLSVTGLLYLGSGGDRLVCRGRR